MKGNVIWGGNFIKICYNIRLKDGTVAAEQCSRYRIKGHSLVIRDVAEEDAGQYTILVRNQKHGLCRNLTLTLVVNGKCSVHDRPLARAVFNGCSNFTLVSLCVSVACLTVRPQIGEKAVSLQDPGSVPHGNRQALHCTSHGVPSPQIQWFWHPCPPRGLWVLNTLKWKVG